MKKAFLFPGQGAQYVGMGKDIYEKYEEAKIIYEKASEISGMNVKKLCFEGPEEDLNRTENTQIAIVTTSLAILSVLEKNNIRANVATGLSLGEYVALIYGGFISLEDGIRLIQKRGYYMGKYVPDEEFSMAAIIGLDSSTIEKVCSQIRNDGKFVVPANYNYTDQTVISGNSDAIEEAIGQLKNAGAKRVVKLNTSGPFHTEKLNQAKNFYEKELENVLFKSGKTSVNVIKNIDGTIYTKQDDLKDILARHIVSPVRFDRAIKLMQNRKIEQYVEIGPGKTLTSFVKKENREANVVNINDLHTLEQYIQLENEQKLKGEER